VKRPFFPWLGLCAVCAALLISCPAPGNEDLPPGGLPEYYVAFKIEGQWYVYDKGLTDIETNPFASHWGATHTVVFATAATGTSADFTNQSLPTYIYVGFEDWFNNALNVPGDTGAVTFEHCEYLETTTGDLYMGWKRVSHFLCKRQVS